MNDGPQPQEPPPSGRPLLLKALLPAAAVMGGAWLALAAPASGAQPGAAGSSAVMIVLFAGLLVVSGLVSACETALFSLDKLDLSQMRNSGHWADRRVTGLLDRSHDTLIAILILNNTVNIAVALTSGALMERLFAGRAAAEAFVAAAALATVLILIFGEIVPKILANLHARRAARFLGPPLAIFTGLLHAVHVAPAIRRGLRLMRIPTAPSPEEVSQQELKSMIQSGEVSSVLEEDEREMIEGVFELRNTTAGDIMTPRIEITALRESMTQEEVIAALREMGHSRVLVCRESLDEPTGFLLAKEVLLEARGDWRKHLRQPLAVPEMIGLHELLKAFRRERTKVAVVADEYGGVAGLVTLHDLLEHIVGDIREKHDKGQDSVVELGGDEWRIAGQLALDECADLLGVAFPSDKGRTLGGFAMNTLCHIPTPGEELRHENLTIRIDAMAGRRILSLHVTRDETSEPAGEGI